MTEHGEALSLSEDGHPTQAMTQSEVLPSDGLGKLAQSARSHQLGSARVTMYVIGFLTIAVNLTFAIFARSMVDSQFATEVKKLQAQGMQLDMQKIEELKAESVLATQISGGGFVALGVVFIILGMLVYRYPVPCTVLAMVLYLAGQAMTALADPQMLVNGFVIKIIIIVALAKAIQTATAYRRDQLNLGT